MKLSAIECVSFRDVNIDFRSEFVPPGTMIDFLEGQLRFPGTSLDFYRRTSMDEVVEEVPEGN